MLSPNSEYVVAKVWKHSDCWYVAFVEYVTVTLSNTKRAKFKVALTGFICISLGELKFGRNKYHPCLFEDSEEVIKYGQVYNISTDCLIQNHPLTWENDKLEVFNYYTLKEGVILTNCLEKVADRLAKNSVSQ